MPVKARLELVQTKRSTIGQISMFVDPPAERQVYPSRVQRPRTVCLRMARLNADEVAYAAKVLKTLRALKIANGRARHVRAVTFDEQKWCQSVADHLDGLIQSADTNERRDWLHLASRTIERLVEGGLAVLPGYPDKRRPVKKRQPKVV